MANKIWAILCIAPQLAMAQISDGFNFDWRDPAYSAQLGKLGQPKLDPIVDKPAFQPEITITTLESASVDSVGLLSASLTGLPPTLWRNSFEADVAQMIKSLANPKHSAMQDLLFTVLLAEAEAPKSQKPQGAFLAARIAKLIELGAVDQSRAMLEQAAPLPASLVPLLFDVSLYDAGMSPACDPVLAMGAVDEMIGTRIYCLARKGDWMTAALVLQTSQALGMVKPREASLLHRFLETDNAIDSFLTVPSVPNLTPLEFRLFEAIGEPLPADVLPRPFSVNDLTGDNGWKAQLHAAERLAETGVIDDNRFLGIFTKYPPAASGGIWDRVRAVQILDQALTNDDSQEITAALDTFWPVFVASTSKEQYANIFASRLLAADLSGSARILAAKIAMQSRLYQRAAPLLAGQDRFLAAIALEKLSDATATTPTEQAIKDAFQSPRVPIAAENLMGQGKLGEVILATIAQFEKGADGDVQDLHESLSTLRFVGLNDIARRAAISVYLLNGEN